MESSNLLKQCRANSATAAAPLPKSPQQTSENGGLDSDDEGPFFDLKVSLPEENFVDETHESKAGADDDKELNFILNSPENDKFSKSHLSNTKRVSSFRIWTLGPRKEPNFLPKQSNYFVTLNAADAPMETLFACENSARIFPSKKKNSSYKSKDAVYKYLGKIKPLYFRVSKKYTEKLSLFLDEKGQDKAEEPAVKKVEKCRKLAMPGRLRLACKKLGKSKSASSSMAAASPPLRRHDESGQMQHDGIQSAIVHCKRSFNPVSEELLYSIEQRN